MKINGKIIIKNQRYFFHQKVIENDSKNKIFRATYIEIINDTLIVKNYNDYNDKSIYSVQLKWIIQVENLIDIIPNISEDILEDTSFIIIGLQYSRFFSIIPSISVFIFKLVPLSL